MHKLCRPQKHMMTGSACQEEGEEEEEEQEEQEELYLGCILSP